MRSIMKQNKLSYKISQFLMFGGPATVLFFAVVILPFFYGLYLTFTSWDGVSAKKPFVGLTTIRQPSPTPLTGSRLAAHSSIPSSPSS